MSLAEQVPKSAEITELHQVFARYEGFVITKSGSLMGAVEVYGRDPDALTANDFMGLAWIGRNIYQQLNDRVTVTQYYSHFDDAKISLRDRDHPVSHLLSKRREAFLNKQKLTSSRLVHYFEVTPSDKITQLGFGDVLKNAAYAPFDRKAWHALKRHFSERGSIACFEEELKRQSQLLEETMQAFCDRWGMIAEARTMGLEEIWGHMKYVANLDAEQMLGAQDQEIPDEHWDLVMSEGDREIVSVDGMDVMKFHGEKNRYARICAVTQFGGREVIPGMWAQDAEAPARQADNFLIVMRFKPFSKIAKTLFLSGRKSELERQSFSITDALKGMNVSAGQNAAFKPAIAERLMELEEMEMVEDRLGFVHSYIVIYNDTNNIEGLRDSSRQMKLSCNKSGFQVCWESAGLSKAWKAIQPGGGSHSLRDIPFTTTQFGATSLIFRASTGQELVPDLGFEEALYVFTSEDGTPFHYCPFIGGKGVVFGVGPIRSGKSFTKNTLATHFVKYGGLLRGLDIDPGMEPVALAYGEDGGIFRMGEGQENGLNPFAAAKSAEDQVFIRHLKNLILMMLKTNDNETLQSLDIHEQQALDEAIIATLRLPKEMQRLNAVSRHCPRELQMKLARWVEGGMYSHVFDQQVDSVGPLDRPVQAFNLAAVKDDPTILPLVMADVFYRVTRAFEDPRLRNIPKYFDVDEAHQLLSVPYIAKYIVRAVRTWGKWRGGIGMWTQSPQEFINLPDWPALRSAASTFFFMADPAMDDDLYRNAFQLSSGECEAIRRLTPKREALIVQPELGVSKKVVLQVEPEQRVISTSDPSESVVRQRNFEQYGFEEGLQRTMEELGFVETSAAHEAEAKAAKQEFIDL